MAKIHCCSGFLIGKKKKIKESLKAVNGGQKNGDGTHQMEPGHPAAKFAELPNEKVFKEVPLDAVVPLGSHESSPPYDQRVVGDECLDEVEAVIGEGAYEGGDEHDEGISIKRDFSDLDLEARFEGKGRDSIGEMNYNGPENNKAEIDARTTDVMIQSGHLSDPGIGRSTAFWGSPILKRSCSNIERRTTEKPLLPPSNSVSYDDLQNVPEKQRKGVSLGIRSSPLSMMSCCSADRVMLKKRSSSQVLPSRSRKLWWKLFLWSHRNLHKSWISKSRRILSINENSNKNGGYTSDTLEPNNLSDRHITKGKAVPANISQNAIWPQNEWVAFSVDTSPIDRVNAWVNTLEDNLSNPIVDVDVDDDHYDELRRPDVSFMSSFEVGESSKKTYTRGSRHLEEEVLQANTIVQSLNSLSSTAHISGMGLKVIPVISAFSSLRSVNLSANIIVHITPGALPKSLHTLDLSRNKITTIEGLRELTRLRVLNLSYNKISRIGHGLSNCTIIKELYLAGNKISNVEGLHRLLKLSVLDLSFNKITTAKSLGQLVANYSSLLALNLLGNPIQSNIGDDQLRKAVCGLLPHLTYLNKQPIKPQSAREVATDSVAKAALGNSGWRSRRRGTRRANQGSISSVRGHSSNSRHRSKSGRRNSPPRKR